MAERILVFKLGIKEFTCHMIPIDAKHGHDFGALSAFYDIWNNARKGSALPSRQDFAFEDFVGWHANMRLAEIDLKTKILHAKICGETLAEFWGRETYSELVNSDNPPSDENIQLHNINRELLESGHLCFGYGVVPKADGALMPVKWLEMPLAAANGTVTHYLSAVTVKSPFSSLL